VTSTSLDKGLLRTASPSRTQENTWTS